MAQSLKNQSITSLVRSLWVNYEFEELRNHESYRGDYKIWIYNALLLGFEIESFRLPRTVEYEVKQAILEFGRRKLAKECTKLHFALPKHRLFDEGCFLPRCFSDPYRTILAPALRPYFLDDLHMMVIDFLFALILPDPHVDPSAIRACWTSPKFVPLQLIFIDNFAEIWLGVKHALENNGPPVVVNWEEDWDRSRAISYLNQGHDFGMWLLAASYDNEIIPWFIFEVLTENQRNKFFTVGHSSVLMEDYGFRRIFVSLFTHWPWQNEAIDKYFLEKERLSRLDHLLLSNVFRDKDWEECELIDAGMLPANAAHSKKVQIFKKRRATIL